jgi:threonine synthase
LLKQAHLLPEGAQVVCVLTGNGLKDPDTAISAALSEVHRHVKPEALEVVRAMGF